MPRQPSQRDGTSKRNQAGPKPGTSARGIDGAKIENCAQYLSVVSPEIAIELRNLNELRTLVGHCILLETSQVPHRTLICVTSQFKFRIFRSWAETATDQFQMLTASNNLTQVVLEEAASPELAPRLFCWLATIVGRAI